MTDAKRIDPSKRGDAPLAPWQGCLLAIAVTAATLWIRLALDSQLGSRPTLVMFTVPIMISAYLGGLWAGLLSTALCFALASYYLLPPIHSFAVDSTVERWQQFFMVLSGIVISVLNHALHRARRRASVASREQALAEQALDQAANLHGRRMAGIVDSAMDAIISIDEAQTVVLFNAAAQRMFGVPESEALGQPLERFMPERFRALHAGRVAAFGLTGATSRSMRSLGALMALRADGSEFPIEASISHIEISGQRVYTVILRDISDRVGAERNLRDSEDRLQAVTENLSEGLIISDMAGQVIHWNRAGLRMHEFGNLAEGLQALPQFTTRFSLTTLAGEPLAVDEWPLARVLRGERVQDVQVRVLRIDRHWERVFSYSGSIVSYAGDRRMAFLSISDITEREQASERLKAQIERLRLLDQITRAIAERQDLRSIYQVAVRTLEDQLPADFSAVMSIDGAADSLVVTGVGVRNGGLLPHGSTLVLHENGLARCLSGELVYEPEIAPHVSRLGDLLLGAGLRAFVIAPLQSESRVFGALLAARADSHGFSSGECEFIRQLSAHVALAAHQAQLHEDLQAAFDELRLTQQAVMQQERLRALGQMASGIAHDINNAISPAVLYAETLLEHEALGDRARAYVQSIARAVDDVAATVARMREFYRGREPQMQLLPLALNELVRQVIDLSRARWSDMPQRRGVVIEVATELADALPSVLGAESEIREALINLVFNAVDAMPDGGKLTITTRVLPSVAEASEPPQVALEVSDSGIGMDEATRRRCLEPFYTTKGERGTGLGLAMVYGTAQRHGARIEIDSSPGHGSTLRLVFPSKTEPVPLPGPVPSRLDERLDLLLVDDDPTLLHALRNTLEGDGHRVRMANGGRAGIDGFAAALARAETIDIVITDLGMPHVDGRAVAASIKRRSPATPVILLTGWGQRMAEDGDTPAEVDLVLAKPPRIGELREALWHCRDKAR